MVIPAFPAAVCFHIFCKFINGETVRLLSIICPVLCRILTHNAKINNCAHNGILHKVIIFPAFLPGGAFDFFKFLLKRLIPALLIQPSLKVCQERNGTAVSKIVVEYLHKYVLDCLFIDFGVCGALGIHIKQDHINIFANRCDICNFIFQFVIFYFYSLSKKTDCVLLRPLMVFYHAVTQNIGQNFKEMGFTASKETGNPYAHVICASGNAFAVCIKETVHVFFKFCGNYVFVQLLIYIFIIFLPNLDDPFDLTGNLLFKHILNLHLLPSYTMSGNAL